MNSMIYNTHINSRYIQLQIIKDDIYFFALQKSINSTLFETYQMYIESLMFRERHATFWQIKMLIHSVLVRYFNRKSRWILR